MGGGGEGGGKNLQGGEVVNKAWFLYLLYTHIASYSTLQRAWEYQSIINITTQ